MATIINTITPVQVSALARNGSHRDICHFLIANGHNNSLVNVLIDHLERPAKRSAKAWESEPDQLFFERGAYFCAISRLRGGELGGYFGVPRGNPFFEGQTEIYTFFRGPSNYSPDVAGFKASDLLLPKLPDTHFYFAFDYGHFAQFRPKKDQIEREELSVDPKRFTPIDVIADLEASIRPLRIADPSIPHLPKIQFEDPGMFVYKDITCALLALKGMCERMGTLIDLFKEHPELNNLKERYRYAKFGPFDVRTYYQLVSQISSEAACTLPREQRYSPEADQFIKVLVELRLQIQYGWDRARSKQELPEIEAKINAILDTKLKND
ncbi:MAG: hypothetical protein ABII22_05080 [Candidatus Micrarchaeota archaeon]